MNREINISTAGSRKISKWKQEKLLWYEFVDKLKVPNRSTETLDTYMKLSKPRQDELKDVGGFVAGRLKDGIRRNTNLLSRDLITLDLDNIDPGKTADILNSIKNLGISYVVYSTRKHAEYKPRLRVIFLADRSMSADEYEPVSRKLAEMIGIGMCDPTTFEPTRLMYWPSCSSDSSYIYDFDKDSPAVSVDGVIGKYSNWQDMSEWPQAPGAERITEKLLKKQEDPLEKKGVVGAFCKTYNIIEAVSEFIPDVYTISDDGKRMTFNEGSTFGGVVIYDDVFTYSHHATDPAGGKLCNAFDLIRIHKFGELDYDMKEGTPANRVPSFTEMSRFARSIGEVNKIINREEFKAEDGFEVLDDDLDWINRLKRNENGKILKTIENIVTVLDNDPRLKDRFAIDEFANRGMVTGALPWDKRTGQRQFEEVDGSGLRNYLEGIYGLSGENKVNDALLLISNKNKFNSVGKYLESLVWDGKKRLGTLLQNYLGAEDNIYVREVMTVSLTAAAARAIDGGVKYDYMPIFTGKQGIGKSTFLAKLGKEWFSDSLQSFEGKEASEMIQGTWINELGELTYFSKSETNTIKQFLSKTHDIYRKAYGRVTEKYPRRCVFFGTSNDREFLRDKTGNRRFWPVEVGALRPAKRIFGDLDNDVDQIWAEAYNNYVIGIDLELSEEAEKIAKEMQENYTVRDPREGMIEEFLNKKVLKGWHSKSNEERNNFYALGVQDESELVERDRVCALEILVECFGVKKQFIRNSDSIAINNILLGIKGWEPVKNPLKYGDFGRQRGYKRVKNNKA